MAATVSTLRREIPAGLVLSPGSHASMDEGCCAMELVSYLAGGRWTDSPRTACPVVGAMVRTLNDTWDDEGRPALLDLAPRLVGSRSTGRVEVARAKLAARWIEGGVLASALELIGESQIAATLRRASVEDLRVQAIELLRDLLMLRLEELAGGSEDTRQTWLWAGQDAAWLCGTGAAVDACIYVAERWSVPALRRQALMADELAWRAIAVVMATCSPTPSDALTPEVLAGRVMDCTTSARSLVLSMLQL